MTRLRAGGATDVGRVRAANEDRFLVADGLWAVADGVGGHQAGEVASQTAVDTLEAAFTDRTLDTLVDAIEIANRSVWELAQEAAEKRGMGTTITAVAVVEVDDEEQLAIANVGDSRVYLFQDGELAQVSEDHSLVAELVREGRLTPADAQVHPQRSIITRALGMEPEIEVDSWTLVPTTGDRLLLCSDGLTNELSDDRIAATLRRLADPKEAADDLVRQARAAGGNDNITVVVIDVVDDEAGGGGATGHRARAAGGAAAGDAGGGGAVARRGAAGGPQATTDPPPTGEVSGWGASPAAWGTPAPAAGSEDGSGNGSATGTLTSGEAEEPVVATRPPTVEAVRPRRLTWRVATFLLVFLVVLGGAGASVAWYARSAYFVGVLDTGEVAVFKGRPGGLLWFSPTLEQRTDLTIDEVPTSRRSAVESGKEVTSVDAAGRYLDNLRAEAERQAEAAANPTVTTVTSTTTTTTTTPGGTATATQPGTPSIPTTSQP